MTLLVLIAVLDLVIFGLLSYRDGVVVAAIFVAVIDFIIYYVIQILIYNRAVAVEEQIIDFVNLVTSTSRQYASIIDIFGAMYDKLKAPLSTALEECYVETKITNNLEAALFHLKEKFDSTQFEFVIDNLFLCSKENGQYFSVATDLSKIANVYFSSYHKKKQILRQAKINLTVMLLLSIGIMWMMGEFVGGGFIGMITSSAGLIIVSIMVLIYFYAMNMN